MSFLLVCAVPNSAARAAQTHVTVTAAKSQAPPPSRLADPARQLSSGWRNSADKVVAVQGDQSGLHVLMAKEATGYQWQTIATLGIPPAISAPARTTATIASLTPPARTPATRASSVAAIWITAGGTGRSRELVTVLAAVAARLCLPIPRERQLQPILQSLLSSHPTARLAPSPA